MAHYILVEKGGWAMSRLIEESGVIKFASQNYTVKTSGVYAFACVHMCAHACGKTLLSDMCMLNSYGHYVVMHCVHAPRGHCHTAKCLHH